LEVDEFADECVSEVGRAAMEAQEKLLAHLLRDILGNPFRPVVLDPAWRTSTVKALAKTAYLRREIPSGVLDPDRLGVLADALADAGCDNEELLGHLRGPGPHVRGCWALDLVRPRVVARPAPKRRTLFDVAVTGS
jgi:hypothetical protein